MKVLILAGGKGRRLRPYTTIIPKPLMPIGEKPILEIIIEQLKSYGLKDMVMATGYLGELIATFFGDGSRFGVKIDYTKEKEPLGTAGPLSLVKNSISDTFLMMNGDILSTIDYNELLRFHKSKGGILTVALNRREVKIDFGITNVSNDRIVEYIEKPVINHLVSMGIYVLENRVFDYIKPGEYLDLPDLVKKLIKEGETVNGYVFGGYWLDIGRYEDCNKANEDIEDVYSKLFNIQTHKVF